MRRFYGRLLAFAVFTLAGVSLQAQNQPLFSIPFQLIDNRPFIEVKLNGRPFHAILDCGADYGIDLQTAKSLGLKLDREGKESGAGPGLAQVWHTTINSIQIGSVKLQNINFLVTDVSEIKNNLHLPMLDGFIGYTFMRNYAVQFDYRKSEMNFYSAYTAPQPVTFTLLYGSLPKINGAIDGIPATLIFDTGDRTAFTLTSHFAQKNGFFKNYKLTDTIITGYGLGGPIYARRFTLKQIQMGGTMVKNIPSRIPTAKTGAFADNTIDGSIGGGILKQYIFTIDYKKQKLYFE
jgi:predicted aspartyl protease